ncbi:MAG: type II toxin-antitoxin system death-on-curing family toxin [Gammaproteobacteria bacterium]
MTFSLSVKTVIAIHARFADCEGVRDLVSLEGTLARPMQSGFGQEFYPTVVEKAAALLHGLATTQPFIDGNKRTAWSCCTTFLGLHGLTIAAEVSQDDVVEFVIRISVGDCDIPDIALQLLDWLD